jgi:hypothetical protein
MKVHIPVIYLGFQKVPSFKEGHLLAKNGTSPGRGDTSKGQGDPLGTLNHLRAATGYIR